MDEWMHCEVCGLKYRARGDGCPRCAKAAADGVAPPGVTMDPDARITQYAVGEAAARPMTFRLPWYLLLSTVVLGGLGAAVGPIRLPVVVVLAGGGVLASVGASLWTLGIAWKQGVLWFLASLFFPIVSLVVLFREGNLRPLGLSLVAGVMMLASGAVASRQPDLLKGRAPGAEVVVLRDPTHAEFLEQCRFERADKSDCTCLASVLFDELDNDVRLRVLNDQATPADRAQVDDLLKRNCDLVPP